jgi:hypothetical protein
MATRTRINLDEQRTPHDWSRSRAAAVAVARRERVQDLERVALSVGSGSVLWLMVTALARLME